MDGIARGRTFITNTFTPINAVLLFTSGIVVPVLDFLRPAAPLLTFAAGAMVAGFALLVVVKLLVRPRRLTTALVATAGICTVIFASGAWASSRHADGFIASKEPAAARLQASLFGLAQQTDRIEDKLDHQSAVLQAIRAGTSDDPRVTLRNRGASWSWEEFRQAASMGDTANLELFLRGGMPMILPGRDMSIPAIAIEAKGPDIGRQLDLFVRYGFDLKARNAAFSIQSADTPSSLYVLARKVDNREAADYLAAHGFKAAEYDAWLKARAAAHVDPMPWLYKF